MTIYRPVFGRKQTDVAQANVTQGSSPRVVPHAVANDAPAKRILPEEMWDGPAGDALRDMGMHPDSPANHRMTQADADACQREEIEWQRSFLAKVNAQMPSGTSVIAYAMLPWELWNGPYGHMLAVNCGMWPQQAWNTMLLAADQRSSAVLDLPEHPGGYPGGLVPQLEALLEELREDMDARMAQAKSAPDLTFDAIDAWDQARLAMIQKIIAMSHYVGQMCIGDAAFARHKQLFAATLDWPGAR